MQGSRMFERNPMTEKNSQSGTTGMESPQEWQVFEQRSEWREIFVEEFIVHNWNYFEIFEEYSIICPTHNIVGIENGRQAQTDVGVIDILARKPNGDWLVVELKRGRCADKTLGQIQRYMGWVESTLCGNCDTVVGHIVGTHMDRKLKYALRASRNISFVEYSMYAEMTLDKKPRHPSRKHLAHVESRSTNATSRGNCHGLETWVGGREQ